MRRVGRFVAAAVLAGRLGGGGDGTAHSAPPATSGDAATSLEEVWQRPPQAARIRAYWWWLNGNVDRAAITHDLEEMAAKGFGGALICDAGGAAQGGHRDVPAGPRFGSPAWRELYRHALIEADRLGLELSLSIQSGWNLGGPSVRRDEAVQQYVWSESVAVSDGQIDVELPRPEAREGFYRDAVVVAYRLTSSEEPEARLASWEAKTMRAAPRTTGSLGWFLTNSAPAATELDEEFPEAPGEAACRSGDVVDLTDQLRDDRVTASLAAGRWRILRFGRTLGDHCRVSTASPSWGGYALDVLDDRPLRRYWEQVVAPLVEDAGARAGTTLKYLTTDSWEIDLYNWTELLPQEFAARRGYAMAPYLPALTGRIVDDRATSNRFLADFRRTLGELAVDKHYRVFRELAAAQGLQIHPESGGPHYSPIDAQQCLELNDVPMSEFWANSREHRTADAVKYFVKQPASAAHVAGRRFVAAEGFTSIGPHWEESLWSNLKPSFDYACTEGLNRLYWHAFVCSPASMGTPGQQYFAGAHLNPLVTWWPQSAAFFAYLNRCQALLAEGRFVADVCYFAGGRVPNYAQLRASDPARLDRKYDYDVISEAALLERLQCREGRLVLPDGMSYRVLALGSQPRTSLAAMRKLAELARGGAAIVGPRPQGLSSLSGGAAAEAEFARLVADLWEPRGDQPPLINEDLSVRQWLADAGVLPDFELGGGVINGNVRWIHRQTDEADIYFVANRAPQAITAKCVFRVAGLAPELWDPVSGARRLASDYAATDDGRTAATIDLPPCGSTFVVFCAPASESPPTGPRRGPTFRTLAEIDGPWRVTFHGAGAVGRDVDFARLDSWTERPEEPLRYFSGKATYRVRFQPPEELLGRTPRPRGAIDLGDVRELAEVRLNGRNLGVAWSPPFRVDVGDSLRPGENELEVDVVNFWPNRLIGDSRLPRDQRTTSTNIRKFQAESPVMDSGLFGPVQIGRLSP